MLAVPAGVGLVLVWRSLSASMARRRAAERMYRSQEERERGVPTGSSDELWGSWLEGWLYVSGYRDPKAVSNYLLLQGLALAAGVVVTLLVSGAWWLELGVTWLREIPGGVGDLLAPVLQLAPWILFVMVGLLPMTKVRGRRRWIVTSVERDLPMALALLSTLVESGLGFDAATERVIESLGEERPLAKELRLFRSESQAGVPRLSCFRRLARRLDITPVSTFVSAMVHSENVGGGVAESLHRQADEVWNRRRELAIQRAQTLPTKLAIPMVLCFLPGIFVFTFGPALAEFLRIAEGVLSGAR